VGGEGEVGGRGEDGLGGRRRGRDHPPGTRCDRGTPLRHCCKEREEFFWRGAVSVLSFFFVERVDEASLLSRVTEGVSVWPRRRRLRSAGLQILGRGDRRLVARASGCGREEGVV